jgi:hypothetical protein
MGEHDNEKGEDSDRPWEQLGQERHDSLPHRGDQLLYCANIGFFCNVLALCIIPVAIVGIPLCLFIAVRSWFDLREIAERRIERAGERKTRRAFINAGVGLLVGVLSSGIWIALLVWQFWVCSQPKSVKSCANALGCSGPANLERTVLVDNLVQWKTPA